MGSGEWGVGSGRRTDADEIERAGQLSRIDHDANPIAVAQFADRAAGQRFGADVADAGAGADAGKPGVGDHGHFAAPVQILQCRSDLIRFFHARAHRAAAA